MTTYDPNEIQAQLKQIEAGLLLAQSGICSLEKFKPFIAQATAPDDIQKKYDALVAKIDSALRAKKSLHNMLAKEENAPRPRVGT